MLRVPAAARTFSVDLPGCFEALAGIVGRVAAFLAKGTFRVGGDDLAAGDTFLADQRWQHASTPLGVTWDVGHQITASAPGRAMKNRGHSVAARKLRPIAARMRSRACR